MLNQLAIGKRLGLGFGLLVLILLGAVGVALTRFRVLDLANKELNRQDLQIITTKDASARILKVMAATGALLATQAPQDRQPYLQTIQTEAQACQADFQLLKAVATTEETQRQLAELSAAVSRTLEHNRQAVALALQGRRAQALAHFASVSCPAIPEWSARFDTLVARRQDRLAASQRQTATLVRRGTWAMLGAGFIALALATFLGHGLTRGITGPVHDFMGVLDQVAAGNLKVRARVASRDEIGRLGQALNRTLEGLQEALREVSRASMAVASGASQLSASAVEMEGTTQGLARSGERLHRTTGTVAAHLATFLASVEQVDDNVKVSVDHAEEAVQASRAGALGSEDTAGQLARICEATRRIACAVGVIQDLAQQTEMLSINASIEAAHAKDRGRGFFVVAQEVRRLAEMSRQAAEEIGQLIEDTEQVMAGGVASMQRTSGHMGVIQGSIAHVTDRIRAIGQATRDQTAAGGEIARRMSEIEREVSENADATVHLAAAVAQVNLTATELATVSETMFMAVARFRFS